MHVHMIIYFGNHREKYALGCGTYTYLNARDPITRYPKGIKVCGWHSKEKGFDKGFNLGPFKEIYLSKALTCMKFFLYKQKMFLSRRRIPLGTLLYEQFIHLT